MGPPAWHGQPFDESEQDYYRILGVDDDASQEEIRAAYRDLVRQYHPDAGLVKGTSFLFRRIQEAYEVLSNPERRQHYDERLRREGKRPPKLFEMHITLGPAQLTCMDEVQLLYTLVVLTPLVSEPVQRVPLNLTLVVDRSTSMQGERLAAVKEAALNLVERLGPEDFLSIVAFSDRAEVLLPAGPAPAREALRSLLFSVTAGGGTEIYYGLRAGLDQVAKLRSDRQINHVLLLTDGHTYGDAEKALAAARAAAHQEVGISAVGIGADWNEDFLDQLTAAGGGRVYFIEDPRTIGEAFLRSVRSLTEAWVSDMTMGLDYDPGAAFKDAYALTPEVKRLIPMDNLLPIGTLHHAESRVFLIESLVSPLREGIHRLFQIEVAGNVPAHGIHTVQRRAVRAQFQPAGRTRALIPLHIVEAVRRVAVVRLQERAVWEMERGDMTSATERLEALATRLLRDGRDTLAQTFLEEARRLSQEGGLSPTGVKRMRYMSRALLPAKTGDTPYLI